MGSGGSEWRLEPSPGSSHRPFCRAVCSAWKGHALWMPLSAFLLRFTEVASSEAIVCLYFTSGTMCHRPRERWGVAWGRSVDGRAFCWELCGQAVGAPGAPRVCCGALFLRRLRSVRASGRGWQLHARRSASPRPAVPPGSCRPPSACRHGPEGGTQG